MRKVSTAIPLSVALLNCSLFRSDRTWQQRLQRHYCHLSGDIRRDTLASITIQVSIEIHDISTRLCAGVLGIACMMEVKRLSSCNRHLGGYSGVLVPEPK